ncbi:MAG: hypothetical protein AB8G15_14495 [Saprospiraceae bacterium]
MKSIKSYLSVIDPRVLRQLSGKPKFFIDIFMSGEFEEEESFIKKICQKGYSRKYYSSLKMRVLSILEAFVIVSRSYDVSDLQTKMNACQKMFIVGNKLISTKDRAEGLRQIQEAYKIATTYDFVHLACELSSILYHNYVYYEYNERKANFYALEVERYLQDYAAEKKAEYYYFQIIGRINNSLKSLHFEESFMKINECKGQSIKYQVYQSRIEVFYGFSSNNYDLIIKSCEQSLNVFATKKGVYNSYYWFCFANTAKAYMALGEYEKAQINFVKAEDYTSSKSINFGLIQLHKTLNALHASNYPLAYELYLKNRKCRYENIKEQFAIIEAYLCYLSYTGHLTLNRPFRLGKLLNETIKAQTDKEGSNVNIIIAELLVYLGRDRGKFIDRVEAVNSYSYRHLKSEDSKRAKRFIKILCTLPKVDFHPVALQRVAKRHIDYLKTHPISMGQNISIEILPFEAVLEMIMKQLARKVA